MRTVNASRNNKKARAIPGAGFFSTGC